MDALLICGGRGTRLAADVEKPLYDISGRPMIAWVQDALTESQVQNIYAVTSPHAPETRQWLDVPCIEAPGDGYVSDLQYALERVACPVLTVAADLPLLEGDAIDAILTTYRDSATGDSSLAVCVPKQLKRALDVSVEEATGETRHRVPAGVNIVTDTDSTETVLTYDVRFAVNVNYERDATRAETLKEAQCRLNTDSDT